MPNWIEGTMKLRGKAEDLIRFVDNGFECGLQFYQDVEIVKGVLVRNDEKQYADWDWECPMPRLGG